MTVKSIISLLKLLNNRLSVQGRVDIPLLIIDIEVEANAYPLTSSIIPSEKNRIRTAIADAIKESIFGKTTKDGRTIKDLREKPVYYIKANGMH